MKDHLTIKERKFFDAYLQGHTLAECAEVYGSKGKTKESLAVIGYSILKRINPDIREIQEFNGITDQLLTEKALEGLHATKKYFGSWQGDIIESEPFEDHQVRLKAVEIIHKLRGQFQDKVDLSISGSGNLDIQVNTAKSAKSKDLEL